GDAGYPLAKTLALIEIGYVPWILASAHLVPYTRLSILLAVGLMMAGSAVVLARHRQAIVADLRARGTVILATELIFLVTFAGFTVLRMFNPDLWHSAYGGEK